VAEVLAGNGIQVWLTKADAPTPMVSYAIVHLQAQGGVMITASHNPPRYNGIKLKGSFGGSASPTVCKEVERRIQEGVSPKLMESEVALKQGVIRRFDPFPAYEAHVRTLIDFTALAQAKLPVVVDAMYGAICVSCWRMRVARLRNCAGR
jgi:phosphomannomutase